MSTFVELEKQVQKNAVLERRVADLETENLRLRELLTEASRTDPLTTAYHAEMQRLRAEREAL